MGAKYKDADASHVVRGAQILGKCNDDAFKHVQNPVLQKLARDIHASIQNRAGPSSSDTHHAHRVAKFIFGVLQDVVALKLSCKPATHGALDREFIAEEKHYLRTFAPILEAYANNKHNDGRVAISVLGAFRIINRSEGAGRGPRRGDELPGRARSG